MLSLQQHPVTISNVNTRIERHGDERKLALDIKFATQISSDTLNALEPGLRESLFRQPARGDQLSLVEKNDEASYTILKHPLLEPIGLKQKFPGYELTLSPAASEDDEEGEFFADVELKKFEIKGHEGGSVTLTFTASTNATHDEAAAVLDALVREDAQLSLTPPTRSTQSAGEEDKGADEMDEAA